MSIERDPFEAIWRKSDEAMAQLRMSMGEASPAAVARKTLTIEQRRWKYIRQQEELEFAVDMAERSVVQAIEDRDRMQGYLDSFVAWRIECGLYPELEECED